MEQILNTVTTAQTQSNPVLQVAGHYRILESQNGKTDFVELPVTVKVVQKSDGIDLALFNENDSTTRNLNYAMTPAMNWNAAFNAHVLLRQTGDQFVVDLFQTNRPTGVVTYRITWNKDAEGQIHETYEHFNANGSKMDSSPTQKRVLKPIIAS
jgi:hypothetical protein